MLSRYENSKLLESQNKKKRNPEKIDFSQQSISEYFADGQLLTEVVQGLIKGTISPADIPSIRIVEVGRRLITLDNRRLRVFKDACVQEIEVIVCSLSDPQIKEEFHFKKTNKTLESGGIIREFGHKASLRNFAHQDHFEEGVFVFTKKVLNWNPEQVKKPDYRLDYKKPLPNTFHHEIAYFGEFPELILEEARAILNKGVESKENNQSHEVNIELVNYKFSKKPGNPSTLYFKLKNNHDETLKAGDVVLLTYKELSLFGMANYVNPHEQGHQICLKAVVGEFDREEYYKAFATENSRDQYFKRRTNLDNRRWYNPTWKMYLIDSLITLLRMYDACTSNKINSPFIQEIISGKLEQKYQKQDHLEKIVEEKCQHLNPSQQKAIKTFFCLDTGLQLVQGPPGTGKTTTLVELLNIACEASLHTLVCAPSNKAIQLLAERFFKIHPDVPVIFIGVEDKLPENSNLNDIFIHTWKKQIIKIIEKLFKLANSLQKPIIHLEEIEIVLETQTKEKEKYNNKKILTHQKLSDIKKAAENLKLHFNLLIKRLKFFNLDFSKEFIEVHDLFLESLNKYRALLPEQHGNSDSFEPSAGWILQQREYLGVLFGLLSGLQIKLQQQPDETIELALMNASMMIFATLSVTGRKTFKDKNLRPIDILIIDEAGQAVEAETLIALQIKPKKCLLVGDTKQLPATVISKLSEKLKFNRSLLWRLIEDCEQNYSLLNEQYRMHPEISIWPSQKYYANQLKNAPNTLKASHTLEALKNAPPFFGPYAFIDVEGKEKNGKGCSLFNADESNAIANIVRYLDKNYHINIEKQVGIITFYKAQAENLSEKLRTHYPNINIKTVDGFQGGENDIIIISFVRANEHEKIGFLSDFRRLNVALTRARYALLMVGHRKTLENSGHDVAELVQNTVKRNKVFAYHTISSLFQEKIEEEKQPTKNQQKPRRHKKSPDFKQQTIIQKPRFNKNAPHQVPSSFFNNKPNQTIQPINVLNNQALVQQGQDTSKEKDKHLNANTQHFDSRQLEVIPDIFSRTNVQRRGGKVWSRVDKKIPAEIEKKESISDNHRHSPNG